MHLLVPRSRSSAKVKVKYKGYISQQMAVLGALVFYKQMGFFVGFFFFFFLLKSKPSLGCIQELYCLVCLSVHVLVSQPLFCRHYFPITSGTISLKLHKNIHYQAKMCISHSDRSLIWIGRTITCIY